MSTSIRFHSVSGSPRTSTSPSPRSSHHGERLRSLEHDGSGLGRDGVRNVARSFAMGVKSDVIELAMVCTRAIRKGLQIFRRCCE